MPPAPRLWLLVAGVALLVLVPSAAARSERARTAGSAVNVAVTAVQDSVSSSRRTPPDQGIAVGEATVVVVSNSWCAVYDKESLDQLDRGVLSTTVFQQKDGLVFDPRIAYDRHRRRFVILAAQLPHYPGTLASSRLLVVVSASEDEPRSWAQDQWHRLASPIIPADDDSVWADYPALGLSQDSAIISINMISVRTGIFMHSRLIAMSLDAAYQAKLAVQVLFTSRDLTNIQPVHVYGTPGVDIAVCLFDADLHILTIKQASVERLVIPVNATQLHRRAVARGPQLGAPPIDMGDSRISNAVYYDGRVYVVLTLPSDDGTTSRLLWITHDMCTGVVTTGQVSDPVRALAWPVIAPLAALPGHAIIVAVGTSATEYPGIYWADTTAPDAHLITAGTIAYQYFVAGRNRYGDYAGAQLDPQNPSRVWAVHQRPGSEMTGNGVTRQWTLQILRFDTCRGTCDPLCWQTGPNLANNCTAWQGPGTTCEPGSFPWPLAVSIAAAAALGLVAVHSVLRRRQREKLASGHQHVLIGLQRVQHGVSSFDESDSEVGDGDGDGDGDDDDYDYDSTHQFP